MPPTRQRLSAESALSPKCLYVLLAVADTPAHGYLIKKEIERRSGGTVRLDPGSLYRLIARLLDDGLIEEADAPSRARNQDVRRRYYRVTADGRAALVAETDRMVELVSALQALKAVKRRRPA